MTPQKAALDLSIQTTAASLLRLALAASFLSAVADRLGLWGQPGTPGVAWGGFEPFIGYTRQLLWYLPEGLVRLAGWGATILEVVLAVGLLVGVQLRVFALSSGILLSTFAMTMWMAFGAEQPLSYSVWTAAAGAFLLSSLDPRPPKRTQVMTPK